MSADDTERAEYGLEMPFVVVKSQGGPYEDHAFVGGYEAGTVSAVLAMLRGTGIGIFTVRLWIKPENATQLDLIAMRHGCTMRTEVVTVDGIDDEWMLAHFTNEPESEDDE